MRTIYKYDLPVDRNVTLNVPRGALQLEFGAQDPTGRSIQMWCIVDTDETESDEWCFCIVGTGHPLPESCAQSNHLTSVITAGGALVWHVFDLTPELF